MSFAQLCAQRVAFDDDLVRNIKSIRVAQDLYDDIAQDARDTELAQALDAQQREPGGASIISRPFEYGTVISYSFDPSHWQATRFSDARRYGVWYGSLDLKTTVYETVFHWHRFVMDSFAKEDRQITGERRVFNLRCQAQLVDLRAAHLTAPALIDRNSYTWTQQLGDYLFAEQLAGLLVRSARSDGTNAPILTAASLSRVRDNCYLTYRCNPSADLVTVERTQGRTWLRVIPSSLY